MNWILILVITSVIVNIKSLEYKTYSLPVLFNPYATVLLPIPAAIVNTKKSCSDTYCQSPEKLCVPYHLCSNGVISADHVKNIHVSNVYSNVICFQPFYICCTVPPPRLLSSSSSSLSSPSAPPAPPPPPPPPQPSPFIDPIRHNIVSPENLKLFKNKLLTSIFDTNQPLIPSITVVTPSNNEYTYKSRKNPITINPADVTNTQQSDKYCLKNEICIPFYLCSNGLVITNGIELFMTRRSRRQPPEIQDNNENTICSEVFNVCCKIPPDDDDDTEIPDVSPSPIVAVPQINNLKESPNVNPINENPSQFLVNCLVNELCVPFFLCNKDGILVINGMNLYTLKRRRRGQPRTNNVACPQSFNVCCKIPPDDTTSDIKQSNIYLPSNSIATNQFKPSTDDIITTITTIDNSKHSPNIKKYSHIKCSSNQICIPFYLCSANGTIITNNGQQFTSADNFDNTCPQSSFHMCCQLSDEQVSGPKITQFHIKRNELVNNLNPPITNNNNNNIDRKDSHLECSVDQICVPFYLCSNGILVSNGMDLVTLRRLRRQENNDQTIDMDKQCSQEYHQCCRLPDTDMLEVASNQYSNFKDESVNKRIPTIFNLNEFKPSTLVSSTEDYIRKNSQLGIPCKSNEICVPFHLCSNGKVIQDGNDLLTLRRLRRYENNTSITNTDNICSEVYHQCCQLPDTIASEVESIQNNHIKDKEINKKIPTIFNTNEYKPIDSALSGFSDNDNKNSNIHCSKNQICVPFHLCSNGKVISDGKDLLGLRRLRRNTDNTCSEAYHQCCLLPEIELTENKSTDNNNFKDKEVNRRIPTIFSTNEFKPSTSLLNSPNDNIRKNSRDDINCKSNEICVPFHLCSNGTVISDGKDLITLRRLRRQESSTYVTNTDNKCSEAYHRCCRVSDATASEVQTIQSNNIKNKEINERIPTIFNTNEYKPINSALDSAASNDKRNSNIHCSKNQICVPFHLCSNGKVISDGQDLLGLRRLRRNTDNICSETYHQCCLLSESELSEDKPTDNNDFKDKEVNQRIPSIFNTNEFKPSTNLLSSTADNDKRNSIIHCSKNQICVPFHLCSNGKVISDGTDLITLRRLRRNTAFEFDTCSEAYHQCCLLPDIEMAEVEPTGNNNIKDKIINERIPSIFNTNQFKPPTTSLSSVNDNDKTKSRQNIHCSANQVCVPFHLCSNGIIISDGMDLISLRRLRRQTTPEVDPVNTCSQAYHQCCQLPNAKVPETKLPQNNFIKDEKINKLIPSIFNTTEFKPSTDMISTKDAIVDDHPINNNYCLSNQICIPFYLCAGNRTVISNGVNLFVPKRRRRQLSRFNDEDTQNLCSQLYYKCCELPNNIKLQFPNSKIESSVQLHGTNIDKRFPIECLTDQICVPFYICSTNGTLITDGMDLIEPRRRRRQENSSSDNKCSQSYHQCCRLPQELRAVMVNDKDKINNRIPSIFNTTQFIASTNLDNTKKTINGGTTDSNRFEVHCTINQICVPFYLCSTNGTLITNGMNLFTPKRRRRQLSDTILVKKFENKCSQSYHQCCQMPEKLISDFNKMEIESTTLTTTSRDSPMQCLRNQICVPFYLCSNGIVVTDGMNLLTPRRLRRHANMSDIDMDNSCWQAYHQCCQLTDDEIHKPPQNILNDEKIKKLIPSIFNTTQFRPTTTTTSISSSDEFNQNQFNKYCLSNQICVPIYLCSSNNTIITNGMNLFTPKRRRQINQNTENSCSQSYYQCCNLSENFLIEFNNFKIESTTNQFDTINNSQCLTNEICVPYFLCSNGLVITNGMKIFSPKRRRRRGHGNIEETTGNLCSQSYYQCCQLPSEFESIENSFKKNLSVNTNPTSVPLTTADTITANNRKDKDNCTATNEVCVPFYLCNNGVIETNGVGLIDPRRRRRMNDIEKTLTFKCSKTFHICCKLPGATVKPIIVPDTKITITPNTTIVISSKDNTNENNQQTSKLCNLPNQICVSYYLCRNGTVETAGLNLLDIKRRKRQQDQLKKTGANQCSSQQYQICCQIPDKLMIQLEMNGNIGREMPEPFRTTINVKPSSSINDQTKNCSLPNEKCMPFHLCTTNKQYNIFNISIYDKCPNPLHICCRVNPTINTLNFNKNPNANQFTPSTVTIMNSSIKRQPTITVQNPSMFTSSIPLNLLRPPTAFSSSNIKPSSTTSMLHNMIESSIINPFIQTTNRVHDMINVLKKPFVPQTYLPSLPSAYTRNNVKIKCGHVKDSNKLQGIENLPWIVSVYHENWNFGTKSITYECPGTLLTPNVILTYAECVWHHSMLNNKLLVYNNATMRNEKNRESLNFQKRRVIEYIFPYNGENRLHEEIALLIVEPSFSLTDFTNTICLTSSSSIFDGSNRNNYYAIEYQRNIQGICGGKFNINQISLKSNDMVTRNIGMFYCMNGMFGDNGLPMINRNNQQFYQIGIIKSNCNNNVPGTFIDLSPYRNWIDTELQKRDIDITYYIT